MDGRNEENIRISVIVAQEMERLRLLIDKYEGTPSAHKYKHQLLGVRNLKIKMGV